MSLERECHIFCRYLIGKRPNEYVLKKYQFAHDIGSINDEHNVDSFDALLVRIAALHIFATKLVDTYAVIFFKTSLVRRKLVLLLAILESCAPSHSYFEDARSVLKSAFFLRLAQKVLVFIAVLYLAIILLGPLYIISRIVSTLPRE